MGRLSLMVLSLAVLLSNANSSPPVNPDQLKDLVSKILNRYRPEYQIQNQRKIPMFSLAVSIPFNSQTETFDIKQVPDDAKKVKDTIIGCEVYAGEKVVAATVLRWPDVLDQCPNGNVQWNDCLRNGVRTWVDVINLKPCSIRVGRADHAEYRTLQMLNTWLSNDTKKDLLLIYVYASPCAKKCTNRSNKATNILKFLEGYKNFKVVFVFSKVFKPRNNLSSLPPEQLKKALMNLGETIGLDHIFRCDRVTGQMRCTNCDEDDQGKVASWCYEDNKQKKAGGR